MSTRTRLAAFGAVAAAAAVHAGPMLTSVLPVRKRAFPHLAGLGIPGHVAVTFDDGPDPASTPSFLEALDGLGWKATFFMLGSMVDKAPALAGEVAAAGHEIAVHAYDHRSHLWRTPAAVAQDLQRATDVIADATGQRPLWMRPPYGEMATSTLLAARRSGLRPVLWTAWGRDWRPNATPASVVSDVAKDLGPGATVLLHDSDVTSAPGSWKSSLGSLPALADVFAGYGLKPGRLADHGI